MNPKRTCLECGDMLHGRADKKFCGDPCRNAYNNKLLADKNHAFRPINRILKKNQSLLAKLTTSGKRSTFRSELVKNDFNFHYFTNILTTRQGKTWFFCYDQGYSMVDGEKVMLAKRQDYAF